MCEASELIASEQRTVFYGSFVDGEDLPAAFNWVEMRISTATSIQLDGDEDYFFINDRQWYSYSDIFYLFWFTKQSECSGASDSNQRSSVTAVRIRNSTWQDGNSNINIQIGCAAASAALCSRLVLVGLIFCGSGCRMTQTTRLSSMLVSIVARRGIRHCQWIHLALSVSRTRFEVFLDGLPARYGFNPAQVASR